MKNFHALSVVPRSRARPLVSEDCDRSIVTITARKEERMHKTDRHPVCARVFFLPRTRNETTERKRSLCCAAGRRRLRPALPFLVLVLQQQQRARGTAAAVAATAAAAVVFAEVAHLGASLRLEMEHLGWPGLCTTTTDDNNVLSCGGFFFFCFTTGARARAGRSRGRG